MKPPLTTEARKTPDDIVLAKVTPRTDIREHRVKGPNAWSIYDFGAVPADFARELERENQVLAEALEEARNKAEHWREIADVRANRLIAQDACIKESLFQFNELLARYNAVVDQRPTP